jgi:hypothetical protein
MQYRICLEFEQQSTVPSAINARELQFHRSGPDFWSEGPERYFSHIFNIFRKPVEPICGICQFAVPDIQAGPTAEFSVPSRGNQFQYISVMVTACQSNASIHWITLTRSASIWV